MCWYQLHNYILILFLNSYDLLEQISTLLLQKCIVKVDLQTYLDLAHLKNLCLHITQYGFFYASKRQKKRKHRPRHLASRRHPQLRVCILFRQSLSSVLLPRSASANAWAPTSVILLPAHTRRPAAPPDASTHAHTLRQTESDSELSTKRVNTTKDTDCGSAEKDSAD